MIAGGPGGESRPGRALVVVALAYCAGSIALSALFTALAPEPTDAHLFAHVGRQWLKGEIPYVAIWDNKPPGIFIVIAAAFAFLPQTFATLAVVESLVAVAALGMVYVFCRRCGLTAAAALLATVLAAGAGHLVQYTERGVLTEVYLSLPMLAAMYCFVASLPEARARWILAAGFFGGVASIFKTTGLATVIAQVGYLLFLVLLGRLRPVMAMGSAMLLAVGVAAAWLPVALYFASQGGLGDMLLASFLYNVEYGLAGQPSLSVTLFTVLERIEPVASLAAVCLVLLALWLAWVGRNPGRLRGAEWGAVRLELLTPLILAWCAVDLAGALAGGRHYGHYYLPLTTSLAVAAAFAVGWMRRAIEGASGTAGLRATVVALLLAPIAVAQAGDLWTLNREVRWGTALEASGVTAGKYLRSVGEPGSTLFVWNYMPAVYFYTGFSSPVRHLLGHRIDDSPTAHARFGEVYLSELRADLPTFIVDGEPDPSGRREADPVYAEFREVVESNYRLIETVPPDGPVNIYELERGADTP